MHVCLNELNLKISSKNDVIFKQIGILCLDIEQFA